MKERESEAGSIHSEHEQSTGFSTVSFNTTLSSSFILTQLSGTPPFPSVFSCNSVGLF